MSLSLLIVTSLIVIACSLGPIAYIVYQFATGQQIERKMGFVSEYVHYRCKKLYIYVNYVILESSNIGIRLISIRIRAMKLPFHSSHLLVYW